MSDLEEVSVEDIEPSEDNEVTELHNDNDEDKEENVNEYDESGEEETEIDDEDDNDEGIENIKENNEDDEENDEASIDNDEEEDIIINEPKQANKTNKKTAGVVKQNININFDEEGSSDETDDDEDYLQKFDKEIRKNYLVDFHPESLINNYSEIQALTQIVRDNKTGIIVDDLHKTIPFLTKYEKTRILGQRAKQINSGAKPYIQLGADEHIIDGYLIAQTELKLKRLPFIIRRPLPNGGSEYWKLSDLQLID